MAKELEQYWYIEIICCPDCGADLNLHHYSINCRSCGYRKIRKHRDDFDLKPIRPIPSVICFERKPTAPTPEAILNKLSIRPPDVTYQGPDAARSSREFMSLIQAYLMPGSRLLDLGCGSRDQAIPIKYLGHQYVGLDLEADADILGDAHALPFVAQSFDCVFAYAVLEHLFNPFIAIKELNRVLKPGGIFIGTVSQGEPFHASYFHFTPWGLISLIGTTSDLRIIRLWDSMDTILSLSNMGRYPIPIRLALRWIERLHRRFPFLSPRRMRWNYTQKALDNLYKGGSICFLIQKTSKEIENVFD
jgi:SAM-dependent methyltransferase